VNNPIPCKCRCFDYHHIPRAYTARKDDLPVERGECIICEDCMQYQQISNLEYLEYEATRQKL